MAGTFDPKLLEETVVEAQLDTRPQPVPEGVYDNGFVQDYEIRVVNTKHGERPILRLVWNIMDDDLREKMGRETVTSRQDLWLDMNADGSIATGPGQNWRLGKVLDVLGLNTGKKFSFGMLRDCGPARVTVGHRTNDDTGDVYDEVTRVDPVR